MFMFCILIDISRGMHPVPVLRCTAAMRILQDPTEVTRNVPIELVNLKMLGKIKWEAIRCGPGIVKSIYLTLILGLFYHIN